VTSLSLTQRQLTLLTGLTNHKNDDPSELVWSSAGDGRIPTAIYVSSCIVFLAVVSPGRPCGPPSFVVHS
jgi:hypothetical protein